MTNYTETYKKIFNEAINSLTTDEFYVNEPLYEKIIWGNEVVPALNVPTKSEVEAKIEEIQILEPLRLLREERDKLLINTDKYSILDWPHPTVEIRQNWLKYRQELRDLPLTAIPQLDENGNLTNVDWPVPP